MWTTLYTCNITYNVDTHALALTVKHKIVRRVNADLCLSHGLVWNFHTNEWHDKQPSNKFKARQDDYSPRLILIPHPRPGTRTTKGDF